MSFHNWLLRREIGLLPHRGDQDFIMQRVFKSIAPFQHWNDRPHIMSEFGAVFNLEFSPEGNVLVAACEKKSILLFDAISTKQTNKIVNAHTDNVNCVKFLDNRMFATCSDDTTVALWDLRCLKMKVRSLHGHSNWVKNIEYSHKDHLLVTSGFDGSIFTWDINSQTEQGLIYQKVFHTSGLMRCRISPDSTKLVICTTGGYLMIIHDLDLTTLHKDLSGFRPTIYRLMQMGQQHIPQAAKFNHVFSKKQIRNRIEFVTDFPEKNDAEVILALQIHPRGHCILSRNISYDENSEWSCVHDLDEELHDITEQAKECSNTRKRKMNGDNDRETCEHDANEEGSGDSIDDVLFNVNRRRRIAPTGTSLSPPSSSSVGASSSRRSAAVVTVMPGTNRQESFVPDIWAAEVTVQERASRQTRARSSSTVTGYNFVYAISSGVLPAAAPLRAQQAAFNTINARLPPGTTVFFAGERRVIPDTAYATAFLANSTNDSGGSTSSGDSSPSLHQDRSQYSTPSRPRQIIQNAKKLTYYIQESNKGKGFIKEPCFSSDGRIICSPFDTGVRLLSFSDTCFEYPWHGGLSSDERKPQRLVEVKMIKAHKDIVLSSKFSPREPLLVTGCRSGRVVWYHPKL